MIVNLGFLKSKFSYLTIGKYRQDGRLKISEIASGLRYRKKDYVILDVWALVFSWKMDKILQGWEI